VPKSSKAMLTPSARSSASLAAAHPQLAVRSWLDLAFFYQSVKALYNRIFGMLGVIMLVIVLFAMTNTLGMAVAERTREIGTLRAIGTYPGELVRNFVLEGVAIMGVGALAGLALGLVTARYLNSILASFPGLPAAIDFFLFEPRDAWTALGLLTTAGILAGIYPSWRGASLPIAVTLREEAVG